MRPHAPLLFALAMAACSPQAASEPTAAPSVGSGVGSGVASAAQSSTHPVSGLDVIPLTVETPQGPHALRVEVALTPREQAQGLMFRTEMGPDEGMLFPREENPRIASFWMRNTVIGLDLIFIGPDRRVINIAANAEPYSETSLKSDAPAAAVLELNAGRAAELGIVPGAKVDW